MAKRSKPKKVIKKITKQKAAGKVKAKGKKAAKTSAKKGKGKKGTAASRKSNTYNVIRSAISDSIRRETGRRVSQKDTKAIYKLIKSEYSDHPLKYIIENLDLIIDRYYKEFCEDHPIDIKLYTPAFEWYMFKEILRDEGSLHKPNDLIRVNLGNIGYPALWYEFLYSNYSSGAENFTLICKEHGIKRTSPPPMLELERAFCSPDDKTNVFEYLLLAEVDFGSIPSEPTTPPTPTPTPTTPTTPPPPSPPGAGMTPEQMEFELKREKMRLEVEERLKTRQMKLDSITALFKDKTITFDEYLKALKELG